MEKRRAFIINTVSVLLVCGIVYLFFKYAIFVVMPFLVGFAAAALVEPVVRFLSQRFGMKRRPCGIMLLLIFYATIGMLFHFSCPVRLAVVVGRWSDSLPTLYKNSIEPSLIFFSGR